MWANRYGPEVLSISVAASGALVVLAGSFAGTPSFDGTSVTSSGQADLWVAPLDTSTHALSWLQDCGNNGSEGVSSVDIDGDGNIVIVGTFNGLGNTCGVMSTMSAGGADIFVAKLAGTDGAHLWSKRHGGVGADSAAAVTTDDLNGVVVVGTFANTINVGGSDLTSAGSADLFVAKYTAGGAHAWSFSRGGMGYDGALGVAALAGSDVMVAGFFTGVLSVGGSALSSAGSVDGFVARYGGSGGAHLWSARYGGVGPDGGQDVAIDGFGRVVVSGTFQGLADFSDDDLMSYGMLDVFVMSLAP
jgi:hypothetical protein